MEFESFHMAHRVLTSPTSFLATSCPVFYASATNANISGFLLPKLHLAFLPSQAHLLLLTCPLNSKESLKTAFRQTVHLYFCYNCTYLQYMGIMSLYVFNPQDYELLRSRIVLFIFVSPVLAVIINSKFSCIKCSHMGYVQS